ncbi:hypothetical protein [Elizabethkingia anophelis]|uniref:hypothetical protein n=1 Tax=Elizabethkingia anophelis TaxID=1117645 RepID=UPI0021AA6BC0|nr:hypothetical protein [Elizabethkingia anophelis]
MNKKLFYSPLWGIVTLSLLSSCRSEDGLSQRQQEKDMHFAVFTPKNGNGTINYPDGFAYLMKRYDKLQKTNVSGVNNKPILNLNASANERIGIFQNNDEYVEFNVRSQTFTEENGDKWVVFPKVKGNMVVALVIATLTEGRTYVRYETYRDPSEWFKKNANSFQEALGRFQKKIISLSLNASITPMAGSNCTKTSTGYDNCEIEGVTVGGGKPQGGGSGGGGGDGPEPPEGGTCQPHEDCEAPIPGGTGQGTSYEPLDPCGKARLNLSSYAVNKAVQDLQDKIKNPNRTDPNEEIHVVNKDGSTKIIHGEQDHVVFSPDIYTKGSVHDHDANGWPIFPPHDIETLINTARVQNYPADPYSSRDKSEDAFVGIVTPDYNYFMFFNGTKDDIPPFRKEGEVNDYQKSFGKEIQDMQMHNIEITDDILLNKFFEYLDKMGLSGKVDLLKQEGGQNYPITKNSDGTITQNDSCN